MTIKMIVMDMDGTLLRSDNTISDKTKQTLIAAQQKDVILVLASGRSYTKLMPYAKELRMDEFGGFLIEVNGVAIYDLAKQNRTRYHRLDKKDAVELFEVLRKYEVEILGMGDDFIYDYIPASMMEAKRRYRKEHHLPDDVPWTAGAFAFISDNRIGYPKQYTIQDPQAYPAYMNKIAVSHLIPVLEQKLPDIHRELDARYWLGLTNPGWLEIMPYGVTKGSALKRLANTLHVAMDEIIVFGDGENDMDMLSAVKYGIAMGNALDCVKAAASMITVSNNEDGIANILSQQFHF